MITAERMKQFDDLFPALIGTCDTFEAVWNRYYEAEEIDDMISYFNTEELSYIDEHIFCCVDCGWWYSQDDISPEEDASEFACNECRPGNEDD